MSKEVFKDQQFLLGLFGGVAVIAIIGLIVLAIAFFNVSKNDGAPNANNNVNNTTNSDNQGDQGVSIDSIKKLFDQDVLKFGKADSKNLFVEVSDPSCPYCQIAGGKNPELNRQVGQQFILKSDGGSYVAPVPEIKKLVDSGQAGFIYIYMNGHGNGELAAQSLYCAYEKNKFWEANDLLMSNSGYGFMNGATKPTAETMAAFLKSAVDESFIKECLSSGKYASKLSRDTSIAQQLGVSGTPGFFVNSTRFAGAYGFDEMQSALK